jgi:kynurenine formamidase
MLRTLIPCTLLALWSCGGPPRETPAAPAADNARAAHEPAAMGSLAPNVLFSGYDVVDLSVTVAENLPAHWGTSPPLQRWTYNWFEPKKNDYGTQFVASEGPYYGQRYVIDEHTGTQTDYPGHFVPPPGSGLRHAGPMGAITGDKYPLDRMMGPAAVIDVTELRDKAEPGKSAVIGLDRIQAWEKQHGEIKAGDVVLFFSGYSDAYYKPMPEGQRMTYDVIVTKTKPGWPAPSVEVMKYLRGKGVWHMGTDGASMGPSEGGQAVHLAGLEQGMSWEEMLTNLGTLPARGAFYIALGVKVVNQSGAISRAIAFVPKKQ